MKKLNLGCGKEILEGYTNLDAIKLEGTDVVYDLNKFPYPFADNYFDEILAKSVLEHFNKKFGRVMENKQTQCYNRYMGASF
jgi:predicted SAM-dependent methyltransferase